MAALLLHQPELEHMVAEPQMLPINAEHTMPKRPALMRIVRPVGTGARVLLVDRDARTRTILGNFLEREGYQVWRAATAREAVNTLAQQSMDLVALDVLLPDGNGADLIRGWRATEETAGQPIIIISALASSRNVCAGLACGADDYITKPVALSVVAARFSSVLRRYGWSDGWTDG